MSERALAVAVEALSWMELKGISEREAFLKTSMQLKIKEADPLRLAYSFIFEVNRRLNFIDTLIKTLLPDVNFSDKINFGVRNFLRMYVYWVIFRKSNLKEIISFLEAGRKVIGWKELHPFEFFFAKLLSFDSDEIIRDSNEIKRVSLATFHPEWYVEYNYRIFGKREALRVLKKNVEKSTTYVRLNTLKDEEEKIIKKLSKDGVTLSEVSKLKNVYRVHKTKRPLTKLDVHKQGLFHIQDKSSCYTVIAADPRPGQVVLDLCSAPGSKTSFLAQIMNNIGVIYSVDYSARRMKVWKKEMKRLDVRIAEPILSNICHELPIDIKVDLIIIDPPCSGTGIFMKTPSMKWQIDYESIKRYSELQFKMIRNAADFLMTGGILTYSTCSITEEENEILIERFLKISPDFRLLDIIPKIGSPGLRGLEECRRLYPHKDDSSGFFLAKMTKWMD